MSYATFGLIYGSITVAVGLLLIIFRKECSKFESWIEVKFKMAEGFEYDWKPTKKVLEKKAIILTFIGIILLIAGSSMLVRSSTRFGRASWAISTAALVILMLVYYYITKKHKAFRKKK
jgi:uncharacterized membrane protein